MPWILAARFLLLIAIPPPVGNVGVTSFTLMKWLKFVLAAQNTDCWLNKFHTRFEFLMVLSGLAAYGYGVMVLGWPFLFSW